MAETKPKKKIKEKKERKKKKKEKKNSKKRLRSSSVDESKKLKKKKPTMRPTVTLALPGSIISNAQTRELQTYLAGQIGRTLSIFNIDEVVVFDDGLAKNKSATAAQSDMGREDRKWNPNVFLARILQYLETPQYLRRALFPVHKDLKYAGLLNPLDAPHHMRATQRLEYREGVTTNLSVRQGKGSWVDVGLRKPVQIDRKIKPNVRVTVKLDLPSDPKRQPTRGVVVPPREPLTKGDRYWGYRTRLAPSLSAVWSQCPYKGGYDLTVGTSDKGTIVIDDPKFTIPSFSHLLVVFGGLAGIEDCVANDDALDVEPADTHTLFDMYVNTCPKQGSRTIRSEEAILISMARFQPHINIVIDGASGGVVS